MPHYIRSAWLKTLGELAAVLTLAVILGLVIGQVWPVVTLAALGVVAWHYWRLRKLLLRLTARERLGPVQGSGVWNELDRLLHRSQAEMRARKRRLLDILRAYRHAFGNTDVFLRKALVPCHFMPTTLYRRGFAYSISKNFVMWYSKKQAAKFGEKGARIVSVSPGTFDTEMGRLEEKSGAAAIMKDAALKRFGRPEEIADLIAFCASDKASYLTGVDVLCDGGVIASKIK